MSSSGEEKEEGEGERWGELPQPPPPPGTSLVRYIGSLYQTSLEEAGQDNSLLVLDANRG